MDVLMVGGGGNEGGGEEGCGNIVTCIIIRH